MLYYAWFSQIWSHLRTYAAVARLSFFKLIVNLY